jgi:hypothetical protein
MYACRDIEIGEELLFNYGDEFKDVPWLEEFNHFISLKLREKKMKTNPRGNKLLGKAKRDFQCSQNYDNE